MVEDEKNRLSEFLLSSLLDSAIDAVIGIDGSGKIFLWNRAAVKMFGYSPEEAVKRNIHVLVVPQRLRAPAKQGLVEFAKTGKGEVVDKIIQMEGLRKDGSEFPVELSISRLRQGDEWWAIGFIRDITERKQVEQALANSNAKYFDLYENAPDMFCSVDVATGNIVECNSTLAKVTGYTKEEIVGSHIFERYHPDCLEEVKTKWFPMFLETGEIHNAELKLKTKDGGKIDVLLHVAGVYDEKGRLLRSRSTWRDITKQKRAEERLEVTMGRLERSNRDLQQFAYVASHDLQEPLRMVASYLQLLERRYKGQLDADADDFINFAVDGAHRMQTLIEDLLKYSRLRTREKSFEPVDFETVLETVLNGLQVMIEENSAIITHDLLPTVACDETQIAQLLQNLIANGIRFKGKSPPEIHLSARRGRNEWIFSVRDNGIGIDPQYFERIFVIFQRLHSKEEYPEGTGIGLAVCKSIVERPGGRIWVESEPGKGSLFHFSMPDRKERYNG